MARGWMRVCVCLWVYGGDGQTRLGPTADRGGSVGAVGIDVDVCVCGLERVGRSVGGHVSHGWLNKPIDRPTHHSNQSTDFCITRYAAPVWVTTRDPKPGEQDGVDYTYLEDFAFQVCHVCWLVGR